MRIPSLAICLCSVFAAAAGARQVPTAPSGATPAITTLAPVVVHGTLPGSALWKVSRGSHVLWVLGITQPLPRDMQWDTTTIERALAHAQEVLAAPRMEIGARVGFWGRLFLIPSMIGIKKLPHGKTLQQVLAPAVYARWTQEKHQYLGNTWGVERLRPIFAGRKLYAAAIRRAGLADDGEVEKAVYAIAKRDHVPVTNTAYVAIMPNPREDAKLFKRVTLHDQQCLAGVMDAIGHDLAQATTRANAWATGDVATLRTVLASPQQDACLSALGNTDFAEKVGITDIAARVRTRWLDAAETALTRNDVTVALLPMIEVVSPTGYLAGLGHAGTVITVPKQPAHAIPPAPGPAFTQPVTP